MPTYVRIGLPQLVARVRGLVGPNAAGILTMARRSCRPARMNFRNRKSARELPVHGADRGHHGGQPGAIGALISAASVTRHLHRRHKMRQNHGQNADSRNIVPRSLRLKPLGWEQHRYTLCRYGKPQRTVLPRAHTVSVAVTIRLRDVYRACFQRPKSV